MKKKETIIIISLTLIIIILILLNITTNEKLQQNKNKCLTKEKCLTIKEKEKEKESTKANKETTTEVKENKLVDKEIYDFIDKIKGNWIKCTMTEYGCAGFIYSITDESITSLKFQSDRDGTSYITSIEKENNLYKINTVYPAKLCFGCIDDNPKATYSSIYIDITNINNKVLKINQNDNQYTLDLEYAGKNIEEVEKFLNNKGDNKNHSFLKHWIKEN